MRHIVVFIVGIIVATLSGYFLFIGNRTSSVAEQICFTHQPHLAFAKVTQYQNALGEIGGYRFRSGIPDAGYISYDLDGNEIGGGGGWIFPGESGFDGLANIEKEFPIEKEIKCES
jgi:hypothetical protein